MIPGRDFVHEMQKATTTAKRTIAVLSPAYLTSQFGEAEWRVAFASDPDGEKGREWPTSPRRGCWRPGSTSTSSPKTARLRNQRCWTASKATLQPYQPTNPSSWQATHCPTGLCSTARGAAVT
jgi:hypothetical protein